MVTGAQARGPHINSLPCRVQSHGRVLRWGKGGAWGVQARAGALHAPLEKCGLRSPGAVTKTNGLASAGRTAL